MSDRVRLAVLIAIYSLTIPASYLLATIGEPRSVWLWRDILGVLQ